MSQQAVEGFGRLQGILLDNCFSEFSNILLAFPLNLLMEFYTPKTFYEFLVPVQLFNLEV